MSTIVFDLEARTDHTLWQPPADDQDTFTPLPAWTITTLGYAVIEWNPVAVRFGVVQGDEVGILRVFEKMLRTGPEFVTWNGRGFDLPLITARAMVHGVPLPRLFTGKFESDYLYRFKGPPIDLMDRCSHFGGARRFSQDLMARALGLPGKHVGNGAGVEAMTEEEEAAYCLDDVAQLSCIFLNWVRMSTGDDVTAAFAALEDAIANEPRLAALAAHLADPSEGRAA